MPNTETDPQAEILVQETRAASNLGLPTMA
jgi:hypothetical protein